MLACIPSGVVNFKRVEVLTLAIGLENVLIFGHCGHEKINFAIMLVVMHLLLLSYTNLRK